MLHKGLSAILWTSTFCSIYGLKVSSRPMLLLEKDSTYDYDDSSPFGPENWSKLSPDYRICSDGKEQSPINLLPEESSPEDKIPGVQLFKAKLKAKSYGGNTAFICNGSINSQWCSSIEFNQKIYHMHQAHFHSPSEHHINGSSYPLELHMVHKSEDEEDLLVFGVLFQFGGSNADLEKLLDSAISGNEREVDLTRFFDHRDGLCSYEGSLTTPPCTEGVHWIVSSTHPHVSKSQVAKYRKILGKRFNNRPLQAVHLRAVQWYAPKISNHNKGYTASLPLDLSLQSNDTGRSRLKECFPSNAIVKLRNGDVKQMHELNIGDEVSTGPSTYSPIIAFTHRDNSVWSKQVMIQLESGGNLTISTGHYIFANNMLSTAGNLRQGDKLISSQGYFLTVASTAKVAARGLYNPQTASGTLLVNGVLCSTYTDALRSTAAHAFLSPLRAASRLKIPRYSHAVQILDFKYSFPFAFH